MNRSQPKRRRSRAAHFAYSPNVSTTGDSRTGVVGGVTGVGASLLMRWTFWGDWCKEMGSGESGCFTLPDRQGCDDFSKRSAI
jgi:hypothetical protein